jgi:peptidoglycan hydrolase CwlO-like protein
VIGSCTLERVASARGRRRIAAALVAAVAVVAAVAIGASASRGDLAGRYAQHQQQASRLRSAIHADTAAIQSYEGSISALQARLAIVQRRLDVDERLLAQVRLQLTRARDRVAELKVQYAHDLRLLARQLVANYETPPPTLMDVVLTSSGFEDLLNNVNALRTIDRANAHITRLVGDARVAVAAEARRLAAIEVRRDRSAAAVLAERNQMVQLRLSIVDRELASAHDRASKQQQLSALQKTLAHEEAALQRQATLAAAAVFRSERIPAKTTSGPYIDPLQFVNRWERTDQGVDATMPVGAPILAPTQVKILAIEPDWYLGQPLVYWELLGGPDAGMEQYVAEEITDIAPPGSILQQGQAIARYAASGTGIEYGWSTPDGVTLAVATTGYEEGEVTPAGVSMRNWLNSLGANAGPSW